MFNVKIDENTGFECIRFEDCNGRPCDLRQSSLYVDGIVAGAAAIRLGISHTRMHLDRDLVSQLVLRLQHWLRTGGLSYAHTANADKGDLCKDVLGEFLGKPILYTAKPDFATARPGEKRNVIIHKLEWHGDAIIGPMSDESGTTAEPCSVSDVHEDMGVECPTSLEDLDVAVSKLTESIRLDVGVPEGEDDLAKTVLGELDDVIDRLLVSMTGNMDALSDATVSYKNVQNTLLHEHIRALRHISSTLREQAILSSCEVDSPDSDPSHMRWDINAENEDGILKLYLEGETVDGSQRVVRELSVHTDGHVDAPTGTLIYNLTPGKHEIHRV